METKHTKGEWTFREFPKDSNGYINIDFPKGFICIYGGCIDEMSSEEEVNNHIIEAEANAKLIAAAPELLEALINLEQFLTPRDKASNTWLKAKQVIKKATE